jgi:hypothetical protein
MNVSRHEQEELVMNRNNCPFVLILSLGLLASSSAANAQVPQAQIPGPKVKPTVPLPVKECRDPAAESLTFVILSRDKAHPTRGRINLTGVVKNLGNATFESNPNQARAQLARVPSAGPPAMLSATDIAILRAGASIRLGATVDWDTAQEFPPQVRPEPDLRPRHPVGRQLQERRLQHEQQQSRADGRPDQPRLAVSRQSRPRRGGAMKTKRNRVLPGLGLALMLCPGRPAEAAGRLAVLWNRRIDREVTS